MERNFSINKAIYRFIKENDKRPSSIADKAGIRRDTFSNILHCRRTIYADELIPIINACGMGFDVVIDAVENSTEKTAM